jgi:hypothetical protein
MCGAAASFPHRRRPFTWQDVAGRLVCDDECAEKEAARQSAQPVELTHSEVDGLWGLSLRQRHVGPCADVEDLKDAIAMEDL